MSDKLTVTEMTESLTGFDEIAIQRQFGKELADLSGTMISRAMVCIAISRANGHDIKAAYNESMGMTLKTMQDFFAPEVEAVDSGNS